MVARPLKKNWITFTKLDRERGAAKMSLNSHSAKKLEKIWHIEVTGELDFGNRQFFWRDASQCESLNFQEKPGIYNSVGY
jgi:hypothetical protein